MNLTLTHQNHQESGIGRVSTVGRIEGKQNPTLNRQLDCFALVWVYRGNGWLQTNSLGTQPIQEGNAFLLFPEEVHSYGPEEDGSWDEWFILFSGKCFELWIKQGILHSRISPCPLTPIPLWQNIFEDLSVYPSSLERICAVQSLLAKGVLRSGESDLSTQEDSWGRESRLLLEEHRFEEDPTAKVAAKLNLSPQTFRKRFRALQGVPPGRFCKNLIMEEAASRILTEDIPIKELAAQLGFCDEFYFTRRFREVHGTPPAAYRKRVR